MKNPSRDIVQSATWSSQFVDVLSAIRAIPADDRDVWVRVGMAVKSYLGDEGWSIWNDWSQTSEKYNPRDARDVWRSISDNGGITVGTLFKLARDHGWTPDRSFASPHKCLTPPPTRNSGLTQIYATKLWREAREGVAFHPYAKKKRITWDAGARRHKLVSGRVVGKEADCILVPLRDPVTFNVVAVQAINASGAKQTFGPVKGHGFSCGNTKDKHAPWFVVEGWADAVSLVFHHYRGNACAFAACGKGSMDFLANHLIEVYRPDSVIVVEDAA